MLRRSAQRSLDIWIRGRVLTFASPDGELLAVIRLLSKGFKKGFHVGAHLDCRDLSVVVGLIGYVTIMISIETPIVPQVRLILTKDRSRLS